MSAPAAPLEHIGVMYDDQESLVTAIGPRVADALAVGDAVYLSVDRRTARGLRDFLGPDGDRVEFPSPALWPLDHVRELRAVMRPGRRTLVLGQYTAAGVDAGEHAHHEAGVNLVLADQALTLLCSCARDTDPARVATLRTMHPDLLVDGVVVPNPDYRRPVAQSLVDPAQWGPPVARLELEVPADLPRLREHVTRAAQAVGLPRDTLHEAVLATHEAAVLATGGLDPTLLGSSGGPHADGRGSGSPAGSVTVAVPCVLEMRAGAGVLHCELLGPRPDTLPPDGAAPSGPPPSDDDHLRLMRMFSSRALLHDDADTRHVRVLHAPRPADPT